MLNICANNKCGKVFFFKPLYVGLGKSVFCSHSCKETHVYDDVNGGLPLIDNRHTFQCPHCNKIRKSSNPYQKICTNKTCADAQRKKKKELRIYQYNQKLKEKEMNKYYGNERNPAMEIAMINAIASKSTAPVIRSFNPPFVERNCVICNDSYSIKASKKVRIRKYCEKSACKELYKKEYSKKAYEKFKSKWDGREEEHRAYIKRNNDKAALKRKMQKAALLGIPFVAAEPLQQQSFSTGKVIPKDIAVQKDSFMNEIDATNMGRIKFHLEALNSIFKPETLKYSPLINYLERNKIDDMVKMSKLMEIIGKITN